MRWLRHLAQKEASTPGLCLNCTHKERVLFNLSSNFMITFSIRASHPPCVIRRPNKEENVTQQCTDSSGKVFSISRASPCNY